MTADGRSSLYDRPAATRSIPFPGASELFSAPTLFFTGDRTMFGKNPAADAALLKAVNQRLIRGGSGSQTRINATVNGGVVTISGSLQYEAQRIPLVKSMARVAGVRSVVDQLRVPPRVNPYAQAPTPPAASTPAPVAAPVPPVAEAPPAASP
jgi:hypothetical protein